MELLGRGHHTIAQVLDVTDQVERELAVDAVKGQLPLYPQVCEEASILKMMCLWRSRACVAGLYRLCGSSNTFTLARSGLWPQVVRTDLKSKPSSAFDMSAGINHCWAFRAAASSGYSRGHGQTNWPQEPLEVGSASPSSSSADDSPSATTF